MTFLRPSAVYPGLFDCVDGETDTVLAIGRLEVVYLPPGPDSVRTSVSFVTLPSPDQPNPESQLTLSNLGGIQ